jgi:hypothetical protein
MNNHIGTRTVSDNPVSFFYIVPVVELTQAQDLCIAVQNHEREIRLLRHLLEKQGKELKSLRADLDAQRLKANWLVSAHERTAAQLAAQTELNARQAADIRRLQDGNALPLAGDAGLAALILAVALLLLVVRAAMRWARTKSTAAPPATTEELIATLLGRFQTR